MHRPACLPPPFPSPPCHPPPTLFLPPPPPAPVLAYWKRLAGTAIQHVPKKHRLLPHRFLTALLFTVLGVVHDPTRKYVKNKCRFTIRSIPCRGVQRLFLLLPSTAGLCELFFFAGWDNHRNHAPCSFLVFRSNAPVCVLKSYIFTEMWRPWRSMTSDLLNLTSLALRLERRKMAPLDATGRYSTFTTLSPSFFPLATYAAGVFLPLVAKAVSEFRARLI